MSNVVDIGVRRWADTCEMLVVLQGPGAVNSRVKMLPSDYRKQVVNELETRALERELEYSDE